MAWYPLYGPTGHPDIDTLWDSLPAPTRNRSMRVEVGWGMNNAAVSSPGLTSEVSANGKSVVFSNAGPITVIPQPDGSDLVMLRGNSFEFGQGVLSGQPIAQISSGLVVITSIFDPVSGFNQFRSIDAVGPTADLCAELA